MPFFKNRRAWLEAALFIIIPALVYLPNVFHFSFHRDDWFYIYDGIALGPRAFPALFANLRPLRGPFFAAIFSIFGPNPLPYHLLIFVWRVLGGAGMFWLLRLLWPRHRQGAYWASLLFVLYPGFLWWVGGFEYEPMVLSVTLQTFSIAFMLKGILAEKRTHKILWTLASILSAFVYLGFVEYAIGMELFRVLCAYILVSRGASRLTFQRILLSIRVSLPALLGPFLFLVWRQFFFVNIRKAADVGLQLGRLSDAPQLLLIWLVRTFQGATNVLAAAWTVPAYQYFDVNTLRETVIAWSIAIGLAALILLTDAPLFRVPADEPTDNRRVGWEAMLIGLLGVFGGLVPIIAANRFISFDRFSHYTLPASIAAVVFLFGIWSLLSDGILRRVMIAALVLSAALTHASLSANVADEAATLSQFWHQMAWRAPGLRPGTTLAIRYPGVIYGESADLVWGPANIIYFPKPGDEIPIRVPVSAARMEGDLRHNAVAGGTDSQNYIVINSFRYDYDNLLVISQPSAESCLHVMDARWPTLSAFESDQIVSVASDSKVENILTEGETPSVPQLFGAEPKHGWCYYYQRADLARQRRDWAEVTRLGAEAASKEYAPSDPVEWIPFLQAHVMLGNADGLARLAEMLKRDEAYKSDRDYYKVQFCDALNALEAAGLHPSTETAVQAAGMFCHK